MTRPLFILLFALIAATLVCVLTNRDSRAVTILYQAGNGFPTGKLRPWHAWYRYGAYPAFAVGRLPLSILSQYLSAPLFSVATPFSGHFPVAAAPAHSPCITLAPGTDAKECFIPGKRPDQSLLSVSPVFQPAQKKIPPNLDLTLERYTVRHKLWRRNGISTEGIL